MRILSFARETIADAARTVTSREKIEELFNVPLYSNTFYLTVASQLLALLGFPFLWVIAHFYMESEVGTYAAVLAAAEIVGTFAHLGLGVGLVRFLSGSGENARPMINTAFTVGTLASVAASLVFFGVIVIGNISELLFLTEDLLYLGIFIALVVAFQVSYLVDQIWFPGAGHGTHSWV